MRRWSWKALVGFRRRRRRRRDKRTGHLRRTSLFILPSTSACWPAVAMGGAHNKILQVFLSERSTPRSDTHAHRDRAKGKETRTRPEPCIDTRRCTQYCGRETHIYMLIDVYIFDGRSPVKVYIRWAQPSDDSINYSNVV